MFVEGKPRTVFSLQTLYLRHLSRRLKNHNIRAWRTWSWVSWRLENVKRLLQPCLFVFKSDNSHHSDHPHPHHHHHHVHRHFHDPDHDHPHHIFSHLLHAIFTGESWAWPRQRLPQLLRPAYQDCQRGLLMRIFDANCQNWRIVKICPPKVILLRSFDQFNC